MDDTVATALEDAQTALYACLNLFNEYGHVTRNEAQRRDALSRSAQAVENIQEVLDENI